MQRQREREEELRRLEEEQIRQEEELQRKREEEVCDFLKFCIIVLHFF